jgi:voltage-gated potassium channel
MEKKRVFDIIQFGNTDDLQSRAFNWFIATVIFLNIAVMFLETFESFRPVSSALHAIEWATIGIFCVEYALRIWTADLLYPELSSGKARLRFLCSFGGVVDLLTILPFYFLDGFSVFRVLRVARIFNLFRLNVQYDSFNVITSVLYERRKQILSSVSMILVLMLASSLCMYSVEHEAQPEAFCNAFSGVWWSMSTLLTVGYGDICPVTVFGRLLGIVIAFLGVGMVAIPTGLISAGFVELYRKREHARQRIPDIAEIGEILVKEGDGFCGRSIAEVQADHFLLVYAVLREDMTVIPASAMVLRGGDILFVRAAQLSK